MVWTNVLGYAASVSVLATFCMSTMRPLRLLALASNLLFASYGYLDAIYPVMVLHLILFPVNLLRLFQLEKLARRVRASAASGLSIHDLLPFMRPRKAAAGEIIFKKGDAADRLYYIDDGAVKIETIDVTLKAGDVFGEIGLFAPEGTRTATVVAVTDCTLHELGVAKARELYYQNPAFGFAILRLIVMRLLANMGAGRSAPQSAEIAAALPAA